MTDHQNNKTGMPGTPVDIPLPPALLECMGYRGKARYVGMAWSPAGDELVVDDGRSAGTGESWSFIAYKRHKAVSPILAGVNLGSSDRIAEYCLLIDQERNVASIAPIREAEAFLQRQWPPEPELTPEQCEALNKQYEEFMEKGWQEVRVDPAEVGRRMNEQRGRLARLMAWLDQCPAPKEGRGA